MRKKCGACQYRFEREPGYYLGVIIISYFLSCFSTVPTFAVTLQLLQWEVLTAFLVASFQVFVTAPLFIRVSRILWIYLDFFADQKRHFHQNNS